ncbi:N,N-dimethylformamidase beta subunit family domain-containing protein [Actinoplanes sp. NPDC051633]|uniref:N,N-dimethylformamidase beta subunit family domain-containing protein n=1 Tax=Actinoplanes sp. NPDC051633 TaxID=3155670 RepID=UPI00343F0C36
MHKSRVRRLWSVVALSLVATAVSVPVAASPAAADPCAPLVNPVACENSKPGTPASTWDVSGAGSTAVQGFATDASVNIGETQQFKVRSTATSYRLDIYRMGYYNGAGARLIATVNPVGRQTQPNCISQAATGLVDCGNWAVSASWTVPATAVSGIYFARLVRTDGTSGASHIPFVVRDDASRSDLFFQTSDTTWQAYNQYGGNSFYVGSPAGRAYKISYNRPITVRGTGPEDAVFNAEYPMVRWMEANGYDVSYTTGVDTDRRGALIKNHKAFLSVGHDEYWSGTQRANVEAARDAGVNLAFFSGNEVFWKTRWESSVDGSGTPYRTLVAYKETHANAIIDPSPEWTGTWRDPRFSPPKNGGRPENALTGTSFEVNAGTVNLQVPAADGKMRLWRSTTVATQAAGATATLGSGTVGYEWDEDAENASRPPGQIQLSTTNATNVEVLIDQGSNYANGNATHHLVMYRAPSGALVFGAGTVQWSWGLDSTHDRGSGAASTPMKQATVNLFADMGAQPATLQSGLTLATASTDTVAPTVAITSPANGSSVAAGTAVTVSGTATDTGGVVGGVEVSVDGGTTWKPAAGRGTWSYRYTPAATGATQVRVRAIDDSVRIGTPAVLNLTVTPRSCPCSLWSAADVPTVPSDPDSTGTEIGVKFRADVAGQVTGIRFYKGTGNTGTHVGRLWSSTGTQLATVNFGSESASGWQQANFSSPVTLTPNTTYIASYYAPNGHYAGDPGYFASAGVDSGPLHALRDGVDGVNGVYRFGTGFPTLAWQSANYWVDVVFNPGGGTPDTTPPTVTARTPASGATGVATDTTATATFSEQVQSASVAMVVRNAAGTAVPGSVAYDSASSRATFTPTAALAASTTYTATVSGATDLAGNVMTSTSWSFTTAATTPPPTGCPCSIWPTTAVPGTPSDSDTAAVEVGTRFRSDVAGRVTGIRFYKGAGNTGTHVGHLWSNTGTLLGTANFSGETATGWQTATFTTPVTIAANTTYVASYYAPVGRYAGDNGFFATTGVDNGPLHALRNGTDGLNGVYRYGTGGGFPNSSWQSSNYWVDVVFTPGS